MLVILRSPETFPNTFSLTQHTHMPINSHKCGVEPNNSHGALFAGDAEIITYPPTRTTAIQAGGPRKKEMHLETDLDEGA